MTMGQHQIHQDQAAESRISGSREFGERAPWAPSPKLDMADLVDFFEHSLDLLCIAGLDGYFRHLNPAWTARLGWSLQELKASHFIEFVHPDDRPRSLAELDRLAGGALTIRFENRYRNRDGSYSWLQWNAQISRDSQLIYAGARDVTRRKQLEREILRILDNERARLGQELHDGLCQTLAGIAALSSRLSRSLAVQRKPANATMAMELTELLHGSIEEARNLARGLGPAGLIESDLVQALHVLAHNVQHLFDIVCDVTCHPGVHELPDKVKVHLYRIAQEAAHNAAVHGRARRIDITANIRDAELELNIRDDGVGFPESPHSDDGLGMHTMNYRARLIGATLDIRTGVGCGTLISCTYPVSRT
jgi:PAS domain S-box-containing protein